MLSSSRTNLTRVMNKKPASGGVARPPSLTLGIDLGKLSGVAVVKFNCTSNAISMVSARVIMEDLACTRNTG
jgi:NACalpha-BTF3-like transcription factor